MDQQKFLDFLEEQMTLFQTRSDEYKRLADIQALNHGQTAYGDTLRTLSTMDMFVVVRYRDLYAKIMSGQFDNN